MKEAVITIRCPLFALDGGELLDEEATELTTSGFTASCIGCEPTPLGGIQDAANVVTNGPLPFWFVYFDSCELGIMYFPNLKIICQVWSKPILESLINLSKSHQAYQKYV